ncbi:MAG TPA: TetR/AcrR family transcriptional regulator [Symbiobacteriaceae bacterium]|nr:TetR/AcrR family transcriptional regulator [Symbiobacteriaceae bacterium]
MSPRVSEDHKENRREQILSAAARCFAAKGYSATTMQGILQESGLSAGAVYLYFKSKLDIYMALMERNLEADLRRYEEAAGGSGTWLDRLRRLMSLYMADFADGRQAEFVRLYLLEFLPASTQNPVLADALRRRNVRLKALFAQVLQAGVTSGQFRPLDCDAVAALILAAGDGVRLHAITTGSLADAGAMFRTFLSNLEVIVWGQIRSDS